MHVLLCDGPGNGYYSEPDVDQMEVGETFSSHGGEYTLLRWPPTKGLGVSGGATLTGSSTADLVSRLAEGELVGIHTLGLLKALEGESSYPR